MRSPFHAVTLELCVILAGVAQLAIASANFFAVRVLRYREGLAPASEIVRHVFVVQNVFIVLTVAGLGLLCLVFPAELASGSPMARAITGFLAFFWGLRLVVQLFFYSADERRKHAAFHVLFTLTFVYLTIVFALCATTFSGRFLW